MRGKELPPKVKSIGKNSNLIEVIKQILGEVEDGVCFSISIEKSLLNKEDFSKTENPGVYEVILQDHRMVIDAGENEEQSKWYTIWELYSPEGETIHVLGNYFFEHLEGKSPIIAYYIRKWGSKLSIDEE